jgi:hypothetical protein
MDALPALIELVVARDGARARRICRPIAALKFRIYVTPGVTPDGIWKKKLFCNSALSH